MAAIQGFYINFYLYPEDIRKIVEPISAGLRSFVAPD